MNRYERYLSKSPTKTEHSRKYSKNGYPVYTIDEAIELAASLPGLWESSPSRRISWLLSCRELGSLWAEASPNGISVHRDLRSLGCE